MVLFNDEELTAQSTELMNSLVYYEKLGQPVVDAYTKDLDEQVSYVQNYLGNVKKYNLDFDVPSLQRMCMDLSTTIYYTNSNLARLGLLEDLSGIKFKEKYNSSYLAKQGNHDAGTKYTVEQLRNFAEQEALSEKLLNFIYTHAAKAIEAKVDSANDLLKICSKCLSACITSMQMYGVSKQP